MRIKEIEVSTSDCNEPTQSRVYFFYEGKGRNLTERRKFPELYGELLGEVLAQAGISQYVDARWDHQAGCACGCSPGFVIEGNFNLEVFVTVID